MKDITSSVYTFSNLIEGNFLYVDKTEYIWELIRPAYGQYFLSRPRRFGKSLTLSTLESVFLGKKELFKGLALYDKPYDWKKYPVIRLDLGTADCRTPEELNVYLLKRLQYVAEAEKIELNLNQTPPAAFEELVKRIAEKEKVVILLDEYDKPILNNAQNPLVNEILRELKAFYSAIKTTEHLQRFVFITGVSKFSHVSIFSDLNNLTVISSEPLFATMLGYTQQELEYYFADRIENVAVQHGMSKEETLAKIKQWYNGYRFNYKSQTVYNPVSLVQFFRNGGDFSNYWFQTGTPTFLLKLMKEREFNYAEAMQNPVAESFFNSFEISAIDPMVLLYQTGYLTIDRAEETKLPYINKTTRKFYLRFPNLEVEESFNECVLEHYINIRKGRAQNFAEDLIVAVGDGDVNRFMDILKTVFAAIPYTLHLKGEQNYQTVFFVICDMLRLYVQAETCTNDGRIDLTIEVGDWIYIIEFKLDKSAEEAIAQIHEKNYAQKYKNRGKRIMLLGVNFDSSTGQIENWIGEELKDGA